MIVSTRRIGILVCALGTACAGVATTEPAAQQAGFIVPSVTTSGMPQTSASDAANAVMTGGVPTAVSPSGPNTAPPTTQPPAGSNPGLPTPGPMAGPMDPAIMPPAMPVADECGLTTKFAGDEFCIKPPPPEMGMQIHVGPSNYDNPEPQYILEPGQEVTEPYNGASPNAEQVYFFYRQQRMRPGSHHLLMFYGGDLIVSAQNPISDTPAGGVIAPEDEDVGISLPPRAPLTGSIHYINTTDKPILKEVWVNFWFKPQSEVQERVSSIFSRAPIMIPPGQHVIVATDCPIMGSGRIIRLFGHKHANNVRWSTYRVRGDQKDLLFEDYDHWEEPLVLEYSSITSNPAPDPATKTPGGFSGRVDLQPGDIFRFECEVVNETSRTFTGQNEAIDDEMCIQNGTVVGTTIGGSGSTAFGGGTCRTAQTPVD